MAAVSEKLTQEEIDKLLLQLENNEATEAEDENIEKNNIFICKYCKRISIFRVSNKETKFIFSSQKCHNSKFGHEYVSWAYLDNKSKPTLI